MESNRKRRVLFTGEANFLATGFSTYVNEVIRRLHSTGEFEIAEFGSYAYDDDPRCQQVPWKFYPVAPARSNQQAMQKYMSNQNNQFGEGRFDDVCLDWKPDIILSIRDWWMDEFIERSPLRPNFTFVWMPTIDGEPERELWLDTYKRCDGILTYSNYGMNLLKRTGRRDTKLITIASPGVDLEMFKPPDNKRAHKAKLGIDPNSLIVGCFKPGTQVLMSNWTCQPIETIKSDDLIIDAGGKTQKVLKTHTLEKHTPMIDVQVMGEPELITLTEDHEILAVPRDKVLRWKRKNGQKVIWNPMSKDYDEKHNDKWIPEFIEPKTLERGDFWAFKIPNNVDDIEFIRTADFAEQSKTGKRIPDNIPVNDHFLRLAGIYLANGHLKSTKDCKHCSIEISLNSQHIETKNKIIEAAGNLFNLEAKVEYLNSSTTRVSIHNVCVTRMWYKLFGEGATTKRIHPMFSKLSPIRQLILVHHWQICDGCDGGDNRNHGVSANLNLLLWMRLALLRNNIIANINKRNMENLNCYDNAKQQWYLMVTIERKRYEQFIYNGYLFTPIKEIKESDYQGLTYDLTIENSHSYVVFCKGVHNTVMRNQKRKLYFDLIEAFSIWLHRSRSKGHLELAKRTFLYLHTSYPDVGYDIGKAIRDFKVGNKVIMTYLCSNCQTAYPSFFAGELAICRKCGKLAAHPPNASHSCPRNVLADIMKTFDLYVQYSCCEGFGMPVVDAISCGVPIAAVDYSAMQDHLKCPTSIPIDVERFFWEAIIETEQRRALPSNILFASKLDRFLKQSESQRIEKSQQTRNYATELVDTYGQDQKMPRYSWERTAAIWGQVIREIKIKDPQTTWLCPTSRVRQPNLTPPNDNMNNSEFVNWIIGKVWGHPEMLHTHFTGEWLKNLNSGSKTVGDRRVPFDRKQLIEHFMGLVQQSNAVEERRLASLKSGIPDQINVVVM